MHEIAILKWAKKHLGTFNAQQIVLTPYSEVWKIQKNKETFYVKNSAGDLKSEPKMFELIEKVVGVGVCPEIIAFDLELGYFLTRQLGSGTLREKFGKDGFDIKTACNAYVSMVELQCAISLYTPECIEAGSADWRGVKMPLQYKAMLNSPDFVDIYGLSQREIENARHGEVIIRDTIVELASMKPGEFWNDDDFNDKNIVMVGRRFGFLDLGETSIGPPLIGLYSALRWFKLNYSILNGSRDDFKLRDAVLGAACVKSADRIHAWGVCEKAYPIYFSMCLNRLVKNSSQELLSNPRYAKRMQETLLQIIPAIDRK